MQGVVRLPPVVRDAEFTAIQPLPTLIPVGVSSEPKPSWAARPLFFALTPSPSPTAWERGVECIRGAVGSPSPATRERGQGVRAAVCFT